MTSATPDSWQSIVKLSRRVRQGEKGDIRNYLRSIIADAEFVQEVRALFYRLPAFGNLRNGKWYARDYDGLCYFKSTDGHVGQWNFSHTRLNLHVAKQAAISGGCVIVDSTRQGKDFPDSFSRTVPIWCAVINRLIFESEETNCTDQPRPTLFLPPWVSSSETDVIECLLGELQEKVRPMRENIRAMLRPVMKYPLRPMWISQTEFLWDGGNGLPRETELWDLKYSPVVLVSASDRKGEANSRQTHSWTYIQGAADDEENWSEGLTSELFWKWQSELLATESPEQCIELVRNILKGDVTKTSSPTSKSCEGQGNCQNSSQEALSKDEIEEIHKRHNARHETIGPEATAYQIVASRSRGNADRAESAHAVGLTERSMRQVWSIPSTGLQLCAQATLQQLMTFHPSERQGLPTKSGQVDCVLDLSAQRLSSDEVSAVQHEINGATGMCRKSEETTPPVYWHIPVKSGKKQTSRQEWQEKVLPEGLLHVALSVLRGKNCLIMCTDGCGISAVMAIAILAAFFDPTSLTQSSKSSAVDEVDTRRTLLRRKTKDSLRQALMFLQMAHPHAMPPRRLMKELNVFFLSEGGKWGETREKILFRHLNAEHRE